MMDDEHVERVMLTLKSKIKKMVDSNKLISDSRLTYAGLTLLSSPHCWKSHFADIRMYLESCMALDHGNSNDNQDAFLTTNDHQFFQFLVQSPLISNLFRECIMEELGACIPVKLAGEVIPGI